MQKYFQAPWSLKETLLIIALTILALLGYMTLLAYTGVERGLISKEGDSTVVGIVFVFQWLSMILPLVMITKLKGKLDKKSFGIKKVKTWEIIKQIFQAYLLYILISFLVGSLIVYYGIEIPGYQMQESILPLFGTGTLDIIIAAVTVIIIAPIVEEVIFRGFLLRSFSNHFGVIFGSILSALIFASLHLPWQSFIPIFILGLIINGMVIRTKSIIPAIFFHVLNNGIAFTLQLLLSLEYIKIENLV